MIEPPGHARDGRWAPWYVYVVAVGGVNLIRIPFTQGLGVGVTVAVSLLATLAALVVVTWAWRRRDAPPR